MFKCNYLLKKQNLTSYQPILKLLLGYRQKNANLGDSVTVFQIL